MFFYGANSFGMNGFCCSKLDCEKSKHFLLWNKGIHPTATSWIFTIKQPFFYRCVLMFYSVRRKRGDSQCCLLSRSRKEGKCEKQKELDIGESHSKDVPMATGVLMSGRIVVKIWWAGFSLFIQPYGEIVILMGYFRGLIKVSSLFSGPSLFIRNLLINLFYFFPNLLAFLFIGIITGYALLLQTARQENIRKTTWQIRPVFKGM